uniref:Probable disease resistance RPP8-like protein 2 n=1 Tax=Nicotiana tabacum TaxID=4097 RepID=A0A1S3Y9C4_TOBAC|nr:PREDICTED: probable disease resistance RPP8-like protein 2 [Nicotiana tabacum]
METRGKKMLELCKGIPGAIIALANLLARNDASEREIMLKNARSYLSQVMTPSYDDLPDESKLFFLYLGHFREDLEIETEKLSHLWTIEGLISPRECGSKMTLLDLTQKNLRVLAQKDMIEVQEMKESCRLVGLMGDMCVAKAEESGLLKVIDLRTEENLSSFSFSKTRRLVIYQGKYDGHGKLQHRNLRSLRIVKSDEQHQQLDFVWPWFIMSDIKKLHALRILDFDRMDFPEGKLPEDIFALTLLRYLSFKGCFIKELPSSISNLTYLQVLDLRINDLCKIVIPNVLRRMGRLQHLYLPRTFEMQNGEKLRLDALSELQTLKNFTPKVCEIRDLFKLAKLRYFYAKVEESPEDLKEIIDRLKHDSKKWRCSSLEIKNFDCYTEKRHNLFRDLLASGRSPKLFFEGYIDQLPPRNQISNEFTMIVLSSTQLKEDPLATLGKLPKLRRLVLQDDAFTGTKMVCSSLSFPELRQLEFSTLFSLVEWRVEDKAMLLLSHIKFENCMQLVLQNDLSFLDTLQEIKMKKMPEPFTKRLHDKFGKQGADQTDYWPVLI